MTELHDLSLSVLAARLRDGTATAAAIAESCIARIQAREDTVRAWTHFDPRPAPGPRQVLEQAKRRDDSEPASGLHGLPIGLKDIIDTRDMPTAYGSPIYRGHRPAKDAICVQRLRAWVRPSRRSSRTAPPARPRTRIIRRTRPADRRAARPSAS